MDVVPPLIAAYPWLTLLSVPALAGLAVWVLTRPSQANHSRHPAPWWWTVSALMALVFLMLAYLVSQQRVLVQFDGQLATGFSASMPPQLLQLLSWFTYLGGRDFLTGVAVALTGMLLLQRAWWTALVCALVTGGGGTLTTVMKHTFQRVRPEHIHGFAHETGWSFPSGHAAASMAVYGFACYLSLRVLPAQWHRLCVVVVVMFICAIGMSRVLLQVHFFSDVMAGFALSLSWLALWLGVLGHVGTLSKNLRP